MAATQFPNFLAGFTPTAALFASMVPWTDVKPSDQQVTSGTTGTTLQNDNDLQWTAGANSSWIVACFISYEGGTRGSSDLKFQWAIPGGSMKFGALFNNTSGTLVYNHGSASGSMTAGSNGAGTNLPLLMVGTLTVGAGGGTVALQWAQGTSSGTATKVHAGSGLLAVEVS